MDEFDLIRRCFAPLAAGFAGSLNLTDDAAILAPRPGHELVVTADAMSAGVHFIGNEAPGLIAQKLLRANLSDLAAMGAAPLCYFLTLAAPKDTGENWFSDFAAGLAQDQTSFGIHLAGGDTTATAGPLSLSLTALGEVPAGSALTRSGAKPGEHVYVSGTLGDAALGLAAIRRGDAHSFLAQRYLLPEPRLALGRTLRGLATACMDISDGLLADMGHLCAASGVGAALHRDRLPLSDAAKAEAARPDFWDAVVAGGDDYELLFTAPASRKADIGALARELGLPIARIGETAAGEEVALLGERGEALPTPHKGYRHF